MQGYLATNNTNKYIANSKKENNNNKNMTMKDKKCKVIIKAI